MLRIGQIEATATPDKKYTDGSVAGGVAATRLRAAAFNAMQEELAHIVEEAGLTLDVNDMTQVLAALRKLFLSRANPFADIKSDGPAAIATALANLGLGAGAPAIGIPFFWPSAAMPNTVITEWADMTFLKFNGASFSAAAYPKLSLAFPGLIIPEARGVFPRIWDDGRGVDAGRTLLSDQLGTFVSVDINYADNGLVGAIGTISGDGGIANVNGDTITTPLTKTAFQYAQSTVASSTSLASNTVATRPRNIAFNFLVRAK